MTSLSHPHFPLIGRLDVPNILKHHLTFPFLLKVAHYPNMNQTQEPAAKRARRGTLKFNELASPSTWTFNARTTPKSTNAYILSEDGSKVRMQLPRCRVPFGVQEPINAAGDKEENKSRANLELDVADPALIAWAREADKAAIGYVAKNSRELMKKTLDAAFVAQIFRSAIPEPRNTDYNPLLRTKITRTGYYATKVRVVTDPGSATTPLRHREGTIDEIERGDDVLAVVDVSSIWFANNSAGLTLTLAHALVYKRSDDVGDVFTVDGVAGVEVDDSPPLPPVQPSVSDSKTITVNLSEQSDDPFA